MIEAGLEMQGRWVMVLHRRGRRLWTVTGKNLVTTLGKELFCSRIVGDGVYAAISHMAIGSSGAAATEAHTALQGTEHMRVATGAGARLLNTMSYAGTFAWVGAQISVEEVGLFNAGAGGTMAARWLSQRFDMFNGDTLVVTWSLPVGGA